MPTNINAAPPGDIVNVIAMVAHMHAFLHVQQHTSGSNAQNEHIDRLRKEMVDTSNRYRSKQDEARRLGAANERHQSLHRQLVDRVWLGGRVCLCWVWVVHTH